MVLPEKRETLTARERAELDWEKEATKLQVAYAEKVKEMDLEVRRIEVKWTQIFRLPQVIILVPVKLVMSLAIPISVITKKELPKEFWEFMRG